MNAPLSEATVQESPTRAESLSVALIEEPLRQDNSGLAVLELLAEMRKYHRLRDFSHQERFGAPDEQAQQALAQLGDIQRMLQELAGSGLDAGDVVVEASLNLKMVSRPAD